MSKTYAYAALAVIFAGGAGISAAITSQVMAAGQAYEDEAKTGGGGAPQTVLLDNARVKVNLISFPKDFTRPGQLLRRRDQLLVYIDPGTWKFVSHSDGSPARPEDAARPALPAGSVAWHPRDTPISEVRSYEPYRVIFLEVK